MRKKEVEGWRTSGTILVDFRDHVLQFFWLSINAQRIH